MIKMFILFELVLFSIFSSKSMEDEKDNNKNKVCGSVNNLINDNLELKESIKLKNSKDKIINETLYSKITANIKNIDRFKDGFKIIFNLNEEDKNNLLGVNIENFKIFIESENNLIDNVFLTWKDGIDIKNGMSLIDIKKNFLKNNRFYPDSDPFSFSIKLKNGFDINKKIKIYLKYHSNINIENDNNILNNEIIIPVKNIKGEDEYTLFSLIFTDFEKFNELYEIIKDNCFCTSVYGKENSIKIIFPENDKLLNNKFRDLLTIFIEDENGNEIKDGVLCKWVSKEYIKNNSFLYDIKKSFLIFYTNNKYETAQKPYQISMFFDKSKYKKIKIKIKYFADKFFYIKSNNSDIIDLENLEKPVFNNNNKDNNNENNNIDKKNTNDKLTEEQFKEKLKVVFSKGISCAKVGNFKNSLKLKFNVDEDLIGESYRNNIKIQYFDEKDNLLDECIFCKWKPEMDIPNNSKLTFIKSGFLYMFPQYPVETYKLFEISMHINKNIKNNVIKIKISYNDEFSEFVKFNGSDIINLENFK